MKVNKEYIENIFKDSIGKNIFIKDYCLRFQWIKNLSIQS